VVTHRISHPDSQELPPLNAAIADYVRPDRELFEEAQQEVSAFDEAFELKLNDEEEADAKKRKRIYWRDIIKREEEKAAQEVAAKEEEEKLQKAKLGDGKDFDFKDEGVKEISSVNPIEDFKKMVSDRKVDRVADALEQMKQMIKRFVLNSLNGDLYDKALECLRAMRDTCVTEDEGQKFNMFMDQLKVQFSKGTNKDFFKLIQQAKLTLITQKETHSSMATDQEAKDVIKLFLSFFIVSQSRGGA